MKTLVSGVTFVLSLMAVGVLFAVHNLWGLPTAGECATRTDPGSPQSALVVADCDGPEAEFLVVARYDDTADREACAAQARTTVVFVYDADPEVSGDEAVFCLDPMSTP